MFFHKKIKSNPTLDKIAAVLINAFLLPFKFYRILFPTNSDQIIIIALRRLGDAVFTIPAINQLKNYHKYKQIKVLCFPETIPIYKIAFESINFVEIEHNSFVLGDKIARRKARKLLKSMKPHIIYDLTGTITSASLLFNCRAKKIIGTNEKYYKTVYTKFIEVRTEPHITDIYLDVVRLVQPLNIYEFPILENYSRGKYILIHPLAGYKSKEWGLKKFTHLAEFLSKRYKCVIVVPLGGIEPDIIKEIYDKNISLIETKSVSELIELIKYCRLFIGNDSGPIHIANLFSKPTFTIYGPTNHDYHKPLAGINEYVIKDLKCSPRENHKFCFTYGGVFCPSYECMNNLDLGVVEDKLKKYIQENHIF